MYIDIFIFSLYIDYCTLYIDSLVDLGTVLLVNLVDLVALLVPLTALPGSSRLRSSVAAVELKAFEVLMPQW